MNAAQALTALRKTLGKKATLRDRGKPTSPEQREKTHAALVGATDRIKAARTAVDARAAALLAADAEYQRLKAEHEAARKARDAIPQAGYRYTAGVVNDVGAYAFVSVKAEADTLAELVEKVAAGEVSA